jgi:hypothetical protein
VDRKEILLTAEKYVNGDREQQYGTPEDNFGIIAEFWNTYLGRKEVGTIIDAHDVANMMCLLKIARIASGQKKDDNYIDLAGYAACGGEIATK